MFSRTEIEKYFLAEKQESLFFMIVGIIAVILAVIFFFAAKTNFYKGAAIPLLSMGLLLGVTGYTVYARSDADRKRNVYAYDMNPGEIKKREIPRMEKVMKNFLIYRYVEIFLAIAGIIFFYYYNNNEAKTFWKGAGLTLVIVALLALAADYFAEKRGHDYLDGLKTWAAELT